MTEIASERGTFVQSATQLATVQRADTLYVQAEYTLTPKEYARVADDATATVVLPNQRTITRHVSEVKVETVAGERPGGPDPDGRARSSTVRRTAWCRPARP